MGRCRVAPDSAVSPSNACFDSSTLSRCLTKLQNSRQLLPTTPLPPVSFERYHPIIVIDSNKKPCYTFPCFPRNPANRSPLHPLFLPSAHSASLRSALLL